MVAAGSSFSGASMDAIIAKFNSEAVARKNSGTLFVDSGLNQSRMPTTFVDRFDASGVGANWTQVTGVNSSIVQNNGDTIVMTTSGSADWWGSGISGAAYIYDTTNFYAARFSATVKVESYTVREATHSGMHLFQDSQNVYLFGLLLNGARYGLYVEKIVGGTGTGNVATSAITTLPIYLRISLIGSTYYFDYSTDNIYWTTLYSSAALGITPVAVGLFLKSWGAYTTIVPFNNFEITTSGFENSWYINGRQTAGATLFDYGSANQHGTITGAVWGTAGALANIGSYLSFDGTNDDVTVADNAAIEINWYNFSLSAWVYITGTTGNYQIICWKQALYELSLTPDLKPRMGVTTEGTRYVYNATNAISQNAWHHIVMVYNGIPSNNNIKYYLDGEYIETFSLGAGGAVDKSTDVLRIGGNGGTSYPFKGYICDVRISEDNWADTTLIIPWLYNSGAGRNETMRYARGAHRGYDWYSYIRRINQTHCYCQGTNASGIVTHNGGVQLSQTGPMSLSGSLCAAEITKYNTDIDNLIAQCDCNSYGCTCNNVCTCNYNCTCDYNCVCNSVCGCNNNLCGCNNVCTCNSVCVCNKNGCKCAEMGSTYVCSCNKQCTCNNQCTCQTNCTCDTNAPTTCTCNKVCNCEFGG